MMCCLLCSCQKEDNEEIEITSHVFVEKEFADSWLEKCDDRTYLQFILDGGYNYQTDKDILNVFFKDGGKIELYNYSIIKDNMIISGEFMPDKTIRLMHPNLENIASEGVLMHELGHYFDYKYQFSDSLQFKDLFNRYSQDDMSFIKESQKDEKEFFAELFKACRSEATQIPETLKEYMEEIYRKILDNNKA